MTTPTHIAIGADHAGFPYKELLKTALQKMNYVVQDFGTHSTDSTDYPDYAHPLAHSVETGKNTIGILICGSANGVAITANKHANVRAAICWNRETATLARQHNDANVLCIPARFVSEMEAEKIVTLFIETAFEGGRHQNRVNKINI